MVAKFEEVLIPQYSSVVIGNQYHLLHSSFSAELVSRSVMEQPLVLATCLLFLATFQTTHSSLWSVNFALDVQEISYRHRNDICLASDALNRRQKEECRVQSDAVHVLTQGVLGSLDECSHQLSSHRWNCPHKDTALFKSGLQRDTKETAFVQAITAAGMVYSIARGCSRDKISQCSCDAVVRPLPLGADFQWGDCGDNLEYGYSYAKKFAGYSKSSDASGLMRAHNSEAGRKVVTENFERECYCHGISGSCSVKTCWVVATTLTKLGDRITEQYNSASKVVVGIKKDKVTLEPDSSTFLPPTSKDLIYIEQSPNHCESNSQFGSPGTYGRECNRAENDIKNCDIMCCGRGYRRKIVTFTEDCNCEFIWCCELKCKKCTHVEERYYCK